MKKLICFIFSCFITVNLFCFTGAFAGAEDIKVLKTFWFDIIYSTESEVNAVILYNNADKIYEEVTAQYGLEPSFRMPVVITDQVDIYNAFNTTLPYNRIVLYNTVSNSLDDSAALNDIFLTTFRHELTHAVTFNMKNNFWTGFTNIFGDPILPGCFFVTSGMAEGAAVASESVNGNGRLNDGFATHYVKQAKIENKFPDFWDVQGANSSSSLPLHYYFNGPFHEYLQKKYGMEKYAEFWHRVINLNRIGMSWAFKKTYGNSIKKEWKEFEEEYNIPEEVKNPIESNIAYDFFTQNNKEFSKLNESGIRFSDLQNCETGIFYSTNIVRSGNFKKIYFVSNENLENKDISPKLICAHQLTEGFTVSKDGRFLTISHLSTAKPNITSKIKIYDIKNDDFYQITEDSLKNGAIIEAGDDYFLVCHKFISSSSNLIIKKLIFENDKIVGTTDILTIPMTMNSFVSNFVDIGQGKFCFIKKDNSDFYISICNVNGEVEGDYSLPKGVKIRHLSENYGTIYFSWVDKESMVSYGSFNLDSETFTFSKENFSGGIFNPVVFNSGDGQRIAYIGSYFNEDKLLTIARPQEINEKTFKYKSSLKIIKNEKSESQISNINISELSKPYKKIENVQQGVVLPLSVYSANMIGENYGEISSSQLLPLGITYFTTNPWNGGSLADDFILLTAGWSYLTNSFGFETILNQGTGTRLANYQVDLKSEFDRAGWKQSALRFVAGSSFHFGKLSSVLFQNDFNITGGRQNNLDNEVKYIGHIAFWEPELFEMNAPKNNNFALNISNILSIRYSNVVATGPGRFEYGGVSVGFGAGYIFDSIKGDGIIVTSSTSLYIPKLIPITQKRGFTYNLPLILNFSLFPTSTDFSNTGAKSKDAKTSLLDTKVDMLLFGLDIQKAIPFVESIYLNDFYISCGYQSSIATYKGWKKSKFQLPYLIEYISNLASGKSAYLDSFYVKASLSITPNIGILANSSGMTSLDIVGKLSYPINVLDKKERRLKFTLGINGNF